MQTVMGHFMSACCGDIEYDLELCYAWSLELIIKVIILNYVCSAGTFFPYQLVFLGNVM